MNGIRIENVTKRFGEKTALRNVSITFSENRIYGLLGRNGAGKSTLLNIISNRLAQSEGEVFIDGENARENDRAQGKLYLMSEQTLYPESMKVKDALRCAKAFYPSMDMDCAKRLGEKFALPTDKPVKSLSTGYNSIMKLVIALSVNTPYVLLDEPVLGLDANHRELFYQLLMEKYSESPFTVVISTHLIEEAASLLDDVVIIKDGEVIRSEPCETLLAGGYAVTGGRDAVDAYCQGREVIGADALGGMKTAYLYGECDKAAAQGLDVSALDLQKLFIKLTNA